MRKKLGIVLVALILAVAAPMAVFSWDNYYAPGNVNVGADVGGGLWLGGFYLAAYPYAEFMVADFKAGPVPLDIGVEARGHLALAVGYGSGIGLGAGGLGVLHVGLKGIDFGPYTSYLSKFDFYWGLGVAFDFSDIFFSTAGLGFASIAGLNYYVNPNFAVTLGETIWRGYYDTTIGARLRLGK